MTRLYAPGDYVCFCVACDAEFMGSVYSVRCEKCARDNGSDPEGEAGTAESEASQSGTRDSAGIAPKPPRKSAP